MIVLTALLLPACAPRVAPGPAVGGEVGEVPAFVPPDDPELQQLLKDLLGDSEAKWRALVLLADRDYSPLPYLLWRLESANRYVRWRVVNALGFLGDPRAIPALADRVLRDESVHVRWRALWAVRECDWKGERVMPIFRRALEGSDRRVHWYAAVGLSFFHDPQGMEHLYRGLESPLKLKRWEAVNALARVHDERASQLLEPLLLEDPEREVRMECVMALGKICDEKAKELLARALDFPAAELRWRAARSMGNCGDPAAIELLRRRGRIEEDERVERHIARAVERLEDPDKAGRREEEMDDILSLLDELKTAE